MQGNEKNSSTNNMTSKAQPVGIAVPPTHPILDFVVNNSSPYLPSDTGTLSFLTRLFIMLVVRVIGLVVTVLVAAVVVVAVVVVVASVVVVGSGVVVSDAAIVLNETVGLLKSLTNCCCC